MAGSAVRKPSAAAQPIVVAGDELGDRRRARLLFLGLIAVYAVAMTVLVGLGLLSFMLKVAIIPALFAVAYLTGCFRAFVRDWAVYITAVVFLDNCRGVVFGLTQHFELPVHMGYAIRAEQALFGTLPSIALQHRLLGNGVGALEKMLVVVHGSHFLVFLGIGLLLWLTRPDGFMRYRSAMLITLGVGVVVYMLVPTVPPWMAANRFYVLPPVAQVTKLVYDLSPAIVASFDLNPIAAMPSLHTAFPTLLTLICVRHYGRRGLLMALYMVTAVFGIIYMGEHYIIDTMAGFSLAVATYLFVYHSGVMGRWFDRREEEQAIGVPDRLGRNLAFSAVLLCLAQAASVTARSLHADDLPTEAFIARELDGHSPTANYFRGLRAYRAGEFSRAQPLLAKARYEVPTVAQQLQASLLLGECAYHNGDYQEVARTLGSLPELTPDQRAMLADTRFALGQREQGLQLLDRLRAEPPRDRLLRTRAAELLRSVR